MFLALRKSPKKPKRVKRSPKRSPSRSKSHHKKPRRGSSSDSGGGGGGGGVSFSAAPVTATQFIAAPNDCSRRVAELERQLRECQTKLNQQSGAIVPISTALVLANQTQSGPIVPSNSIPPPPPVKPFNEPPVRVLPPPPPPPPSPPPPLTLKAPPQPPKDTPSKAMPATVFMADQVKGVKLNPIKPLQLKDTPKPSEPQNFNTALIQKAQIQNKFRIANQEESFGDEIESAQNRIEKLKSEIPQTEKSIQTLMNKQAVDPLDEEILNLDKIAKQKLLDFQKNSLHKAEISLQKWQLKAVTSKPNTEQKTKLREFENEEDKLKKTVKTTKKASEDSETQLKNFKTIVGVFKNQKNEVDTILSMEQNGKSKEAQKLRKDLTPQIEDSVRQIKRFLPTFDYKIPTPPLPPRNATPSPEPKQPETKPRASKIAASSKIHEQLTSNRRK